MWKCDVSKIHPKSHKETYSLINWTIPSLLNTWYNFMNLKGKHNFIQVKIEVAFCSLKQKLLYFMLALDGNTRPWLTCTTRSCRWKLVKKEIIAKKHFNTDNRLFLKKEKIGQNQKTIPRNFKDLYIKMFN